MPDTMPVSDDRRLRDAVADGARFVSVFHRLAGKGGPDPAGTADRTHCHHNPPAAAAATACSDADSDSPSPEAAESVLPKASWQPLPPSVPKRRRVGTSPTTGSTAPPPRPRRGPTEATASASGPTEHPDVEARPRQRRRLALVPKPSTVSHVARSPSQKALQKAFIKWWTQGNPLAQSKHDASPTPSPAEPSKDGQLIQGCLAQLGFAAAVIMGVGGGLNDVLSGWNKALKAIVVLSLILGAGTLGAGLMATSVMSTGYTRAVLSTSARFCTCLAVFMLIVDLSLHMGSYGYIAGIILGSVAVLFAVSVWIKGDPAAYGVYMRVQNGTKHLCGSLKRSCERHPILPT